MIAAAQLASLRFIDFFWPILIFGFTSFDMIYNPSGIVYEGDLFPPSPDDGCGGMSKATTSPLLNPEVTAAATLLRTPSSTSRRRQPSGERRNTNGLPPPSPSKIAASGATVASCFDSSSTSALAERSGSTRGSSLSSLSRIGIVRMKLGLRPATGTAPIEYT